MKKGTISKLLDYFFNNHKDEVSLAMQEFFGKSQILNGKIELKDEREQGLFMEWVTFDYRLKNGKKLIDDFITENPLNLSEGGLKVYEDMQMNKYGWYEIIAVKLDEYLDLESLQSGKVYRTLEKAGTHGAEPKNTMICRVGKVGDHWELLGSDPIVLPVYHTKRMKALFRKDMSQWTPKDSRELLNNDTNSPNKLEQSIAMTEAEIEQKKRKIKKKIANQLVKIGSITTVEEVLESVYSEKGKAVNALQKLMLMLSDPLVEPTQKLIDLASDVWNYFPHKSLAGKSPTEKAQEIYGDKSNQNLATVQKEVDITTINKSGLPVGAFIPLSAILPNTAEKETKVIKLHSDRKGLRAGEYKIVENYCADQYCDCRKVMINVVDEKSKIRATIGFGWEPAKYYEKWAGDKEMAQMMVGAYLEEGGIQTKDSQECLKLIQKAVKDIGYVNRLQRHYKQFKEGI
ncbi:MAG: hypothetical protein WCO23_01075 [bacterium]